MPCPRPRRTGTGAFVGYSPVPRGLPLISGGAASTSSLSRPAQASLAFGPQGRSTAQGGLCHRASVPPGYPTRPPVSYQIKPTTVWVDPSSTGVTRRRGALRYPGSSASGMSTGSPAATRSKPCENSGGGGNGGLGHHDLRRSHVIWRFGAGSPAGRGSRPPWIDVGRPILDRPPSHALAAAIKAGTPTSEIARRML